METRSSPAMRRSDGARTHAAILDAAARLASVRGLNGLTIGSLAEALGVSKSGLYAHFGSKERLQLETIEAANAIFEREVTAPASHAEPGLAQLRAIAERYFSYVEREVFPGGCFFALVGTEMAPLEGAVHDAVAENFRAWLAFLSSVVEEAQRRGELRADADPGQLVFEIEAQLVWATSMFVLMRDPAALNRGRAGIERAIEAARPAPPRSRARR